MYIVVSQRYERLFFHILSFLIRSSHTLHCPQLQFCEMGEAATERSSWFRPPKSCKEEVSLLERSKPKSIQYKDKWAVDVFRNRKAMREKKKISFTPAGECVQRLCSPCEDSCKKF